MGLPELLFILVLALLVFGPRKLPEIGRTLGRALGEFRRATSDLKRSLDVELAEETPPPAGPPAAELAPARPVEPPKAGEEEAREAAREATPAVPRGSTTADESGE